MAISWVPASGNTPFESATKKVKVRQARLGPKLRLTRRLVACVIHEVMFCETGGGLDWFVLWLFVNWGIIALSLILVWNDTFTDLNFFNLTFLYQILTSCRHLVARVWLRHCSAIDSLISMQTRRGYESDVCSHAIRFCCICCHKLRLRATKSHSWALWGFLALGGQVLVGWVKWGVWVRRVVSSLPRHLLFDILGQVEAQWLFKSLARGFTPNRVMTLLYEVFGQHVILVFHILIVVFEEVFVILKQNWNNTSVKLWFTQEMNTSLN